MNKTSGGDRIPVKPFQILKDDLSTGLGGVGGLGVGGLGAVPGAVGLGGKVCSGISERMAWDVCLCLHTRAHTEVT